MATNHQSLRLDLVIRTSKRKRDAKSPQQQRDMAEASARLNTHEIVHVHDSGTDESGKTMDRATLRAVMERVQRGETDGMIVALADRLGRAKIEEAMAYVRQLTGVGVLVLADMGGVPINLNDPAIETSLVIQLQMARQYWLMTANRFARSQRDALAAGKFIGPTPLGYQRRSGRLYPDPVLGPIVTEAYRLAATQGIYAAVSYLQAMVPDRDWSTPTHVRRLLRSRVYLGESRCGRTLPANLEAHKPLTDPAIHAAAQTDPRPRRPSGEYPLSHEVVCGACGAGMVGAVKTVRGVSYRRMQCSVSAPGCASIVAGGLENHVRAEVADALEGEWLDVGDTGAAALEGARVALANAEHDRKLFAMDTSARRLLGDDAWHAAAERHLTAVDAAQANFRAAAAVTAREESLPTAGELVDDAKLVRAIRVMRGRGVTIAVRPGRGSVSERVVISWPAGHDGAGTLAA